MNRVTAAASTALLMAFSPSAFSAADVTVAHFAPFADTIDGTAVNISVNGAPVEALQGFKFKEFTDPLAFDAGSYTIDVFLPGGTDPVITGDFTLDDGVSYTVYAAGDIGNQDLELRAIVNDTPDPAAGNLSIRILHAAPFAADLAATEVSIRLADGTVVNNLVGVPYNGDSMFFEIPAGAYDLKVASNDGSVNYIDPLEADLPAGAALSIFAVGNIVNQPLGIMALPLGELPTRTPVNNSTNGTWEIIEGSGTGFIFQPIPAQNRATGSWYTYVDGAPIFYTFDSCMLMEGTCANPGGFDGEMATVDLYLSTGGGAEETDVVETVKVGEIDFMFPEGCFFADATVRIDGQMDADFTAANLTAAFCNDEL